jgi:hypothetical protein
MTLINWHDDLPGGYRGDNVPDTLKLKVKAMDRTELEERYLDAMARFYETYDEFEAYILAHPPFQYDPAAMPPDLRLREGPKEK